MISHVLIASVLALLSSVDASKTCNGLGNNLQRCFSTSSALASAYCSSYLSIPIVTVTRTLSAITTIPTVVSTEVDVSTSTSISTTLSFVTITTIQTTFTTTIITTSAVIVPPPRNKKRKVTPSSLVCLTSTKSILYPAASISSACSCLNITPITVTATAPASTKTSYTPQTTTTSTATVIQVVTTVPTTTTLTNQETDIITSTSTSASVPPAACTPSGTVTNSEGYTFAQIFAGSGFSENSNNPSNQATPDVTTLDGTLDACQAVQACADYVFSVPNFDFNFDVHYLISEKVWSCTGYYNALSSASDWNVASSDIGASYGYQF